MKTQLQFMSENALLMFSSKSFMVLCLIFKSLSYFKFIFVYGVRLCSNFIDLHAVLSFRLHLLRARLSWRLIYHRCMGLFLDSLFSWLIHISVFVPIHSVLILVTLQYWHKFFFFNLFVCLKDNFRIIGWESA